MAQPFPACKVFLHPVPPLMLARVLGGRQGGLSMCGEATATVAGGGVEALVSRGGRAAASHPECPQLSGSSQGLRQVLGVLHPSSSYCNAT